MRHSVAIAINLTPRRLRAALAAAALWTVGALGYLVLEAAAARGVEPSYSYARAYISDLGVPEASPRAAVMQTAFYVQGSFFLAGAACLASAWRGRWVTTFVCLVATNAVGNVLVGAFHAGPVHVTGAGMAIVGGNLAILAAAAAVGVAGGPRWYRAVSNVVGTLGLLFLLVLMLRSWAAVTLLPIGIAERGSVYSITGWQLFSVAGIIVCIRRPPAIGTGL